MENQNFKCINLRTDFMFTNLLKNEADILLNLVSNDAIKRLRKASQRLKHVLFLFFIVIRVQENKK